VTELLLITDVPRLRKIFSRLSEDKEIRLRIANNLEQGGEEILVEKPAMVFVQTHLSGLSADILLMHLKKQLGRKRTRFVLLTPPDQVSNDIHKLYQGQINTALKDEALYHSIRDMVGSLTAKIKKAVTATDVATTQDVPGQEDIKLKSTNPASTPSSPPQDEERLLLPELTPNSDSIHVSEQIESSLEEQGITYAAPRPKISVYSEFTNSFENAVNNMQEPEPAEADVAPPPAGPALEWTPEHFVISEPLQPRPKKTSFLLWLAPVLLAVVVVTILQNKRTSQEPVSVDVSAKRASTPTPPAAGAPPVSQAPVIALEATIRPGNPPAGSGTETQLTDKAILSAIAENNGTDQSKGKLVSRLTVLPEFIPRAGLDKGYTAANPGWERYKGHVTEFRVYRENSFIRAIQTIDRGGQGVPEAFMKTVLRQVSKKPVFVMESSEKKEAYEIQRGRIADDIKVVYYRDQKGGTLRAFVLTWK
jgi:hypothetical protein